VAKREPIPEDPGAQLLEALAADFSFVLNAVSVPAFVVDNDRRLRWQNAASLALVGDLRGRLDAGVMLDPEDLQNARAAFARKQQGAPHTRLELTVTRPDGTRVRVSVDSVPLRDKSGAMIGSFGLVHELADVDPSLPDPPSLTPRERQALTLLAAGYSTTQMAHQMDIATVTVRNHVKSVLRRLGAHSRIEAVAKARLFGLV
jgi:DNA-binding CsgD family transcriptional regulator